MPTKTEFKYNPETKRMEKVEVEVKASSSGDGGPYTTFIVKGRQLGALLAFAKEDGYDVSTPNKKGAAVNAYVRAAIDDLLKARSKEPAKA